MPESSPAITTGPLLRLDMSNQTAVATLKALLDRYERSYREVEPLWADKSWPAPSFIADHPFHCVEAIISVLLEKGEVYTQEASRHLNSAELLFKFRRLVHLVMAIDGVELISGSAR